MVRGEETKMDTTGNNNTGVTGALCSISSPPQQSSTSFMQTYHIYNSTLIPWESNHVTSSCICDTEPGTACETHTASRVEDSECTTLLFLHTVDAVFIYIVYLIRLD